MVRRVVSSLALVLGVWGCIAPMTPAERLSFTAYDMNAATRFGRMDVAIAHVSTEAQSDFLRRHSRWHGDLRVVDVDVSGIRMLTPTSAEVHLTVSWHHDDETIMRTSQLAQRWTTLKGDDWKLNEELHVAGDEGVFEAAGSKTPRTEPAKQPVEVLGQITHDGWQ